MMLDVPFARHRAFISSSASVPTFSSPTAAANLRSPSPSPIRPFPSSASSSSSSNRLHSPHSFSHNACVALAPAAAFLLDLGGTLVLSVLASGLLVAYFLDSLRLKSAAFFAVWFSLVAAQLAFFFSTSSTPPSPPSPSPHSPFSSAPRSPSSLASEPPSRPLWPVPDWHAGRAMPAQARAVPCRTWSVGWTFRARHGPV